MRLLLKFIKTIPKYQNVRLINSSCRMNYNNKIGNENRGQISLINKSENESCIRHFCTPKIDPIAASLIDLATFETVCSDTLEALCDYFEEVLEKSSNLKSADVTFGDGVLNVKLGEPFGTYVINRQTPNRQIWFSSPVSGPKRFDFVQTKSTPKVDGYWYYKHDGSTLHATLQNELKSVLNSEIDISSLPYGSK